MIFVWSYNFLVHVCSRWKFCNWSKKVIVFARYLKSLIFCLPTLRSLSSSKRFCSSQRSDFRVELMLISFLDVRRLRYSAQILKMVCGFLSNWNSCVLTLSIGLLCFIGVLEVRLFPFQKHPRVIFDISKKKDLFDTNLMKIWQKIP